MICATVSSDDDGCAWHGHSAKGIDAHVSKQYAG
jgi:hypothetical protein